MFKTTFLINLVKTEEPDISDIRRIVMSRLDELIAEYCPNGVEYKKIKTLICTVDINPDCSQYLRPVKYK